MRIIIIGGGVAGSEVAWQLRRLNKEVEIIILEKSEFLQYSPCALPYVIGDKIKKIDEIFLFDRSFYNDNKIILNSKARVKKINKAKKEVFFEKDKKTETLKYDYLVIATGATIKQPDIPGLKDCDYSTLKTITDAEKIKGSIKPNEKAVILGAGYIGVELAEALHLNNLEVFLLEAQGHLLPSTFDHELALQIQSFMEKSGINIITNAQIKNIASQKIDLNNKIIEYDHLFACCGFQPNINLALATDLKCGKGIIIDSQGRTSDENIYACGDCVESVNLIDNHAILNQLATTAVFQARVVAENILGNQRENRKVINASISRFYKIIFGSCGVTEKYCQLNNVKTVSVVYTGKSRAEYYPGSQDIFVKIITQLNGRIIGCQIAGFEEIAGRLNMISLAIGKGITLKEFIETETCYNPSVTPVFDPLITAAEVCLKKVDFQNDLS